MKKVFMSMAALVLMGGAASAQISLKSLINTEALTNMANTLTEQKDLSLADLTGTWHYSKPACEFESNDLLKKAGGSLVSSQIETKLSEAYKKVGITASNFTFTFKADSTFSCVLKGKTFVGKVSKDAKGQYTLHYTTAQGLMNLGAVRVYIRKAGSTLTILYDADKLLKIVNYMSKVTQNTTVSALASVADSYDGLLVGYSLTK